MISESEWHQRARELGLVDAAGYIKPNVVLIHGVDESGDIVMAELVTPLRAPEYTEDLQRKSPPWRFNRTADGRVVLPGRWFVEVFAAIRDDATRRHEERAIAARASAVSSLEDVVLPDGCVVIEHAIKRPDGVISCEMLLPPVTFNVQLPRVD